MSDRQRAIVLVVDDLDAKRYVLARILTGAGYEVREATTGAEGLRLAAERPDLIVLDVVLPDVDGFEVARRLKADPATAAIPVVQVTNALPATPENRIHALESGADAYVPGPFDARELLATVNAMLRARRAEARARRASDFLNLIIGQAPALLVAVDADGRIALFNPECERVTGYRSDDVLGQSMLPLLVPETWREAVAGRFATADARTLAAPHTHPWITRGGEERLVEWRCFRLPAPSPMVVGVGVDVTEQRKAEEERARLLGDAQAAHREAQAASEAKDRFLATVSHELRSPLGTILGALSMLRRDVSADRRARLMDLVERNVRVQVRLVDDLLDASRVHAGKLQLRRILVDVGPVVRYAIESVRQDARTHGVGIVSAFVTLDPLFVLGDPERLHQVFANLLSNAVKFTPAGGRVVVTVERANDEIRVAVQDTGEGIDPALLPHLFEPFRQGESTTGTGLGLGLAIVRSLVEAHQGTVHAESAGRGEGATFVVLLPLLTARV